MARFDAPQDYVAAMPHAVPVEMEKSYADIALLLELELSVQESFYFAAMILPGVCKNTTLE